MANNQSGSFLAGLLVGTALGTVTGLLAAPRSGRETRKLIRKSADALPELVEDLSTTLQLQADRLSDSARQSWGETLDRLRVAIAEGIEATQQQRQLLRQLDESESIDVYPDEALPPERSHADAH
jgi:gas vesicle protein